MEKAERDLILRQGVTLPETPRDRREREALDEDLAGIAAQGHRPSVRLLNFRPTAESYLAASRGPLAYMLRLREIETRKAEHEASLGDRWRGLALECAPDAGRFAVSWQREAAAARFVEVNDLVERHNRWYPVESRLPMDPRSGDFALVNGRDYRLEPLNASWVLGRFPADLAAALASFARR
jgi:hypothetical protein